MNMTRLWIATFVLAALTAGGGILLGYSLGSEADALAEAQFEMEVAQRDAETARQEAEASKLAAEAARQDAETAKAALADVEAKLASFETPIHRDTREIYRDNDRIRAKVSLTNFYGLDLPVHQSTLSVLADGYDTSSESPLVLRIECMGGDRRVTINNVATPPRTDGDVYDEYYSVVYQVLPAPQQLPDRVHISHASLWKDLDETYTVSLLATSLLYLLAREAETLEVMIEGANGELVSAVFSMDGVWDTPITPNIDRCGDYHY